MTSFRKTALAGGILYLLTFLGSIPAAILVGPVLDNPNYITSAGADQQVAFGLILELVNVISCFGCAVALFSVVRREHEGLAIGYLATRMFEAATITIGIVSLLAVVSLRQQGAAAGDAESLVPTGHALVAIRTAAMTIGPNMAAFNALMLGTALYRARLVPRWIPALGIVGAPLLIAFVIGTILGVTGQGTLFQGIAVLPFFVWELVLGLWLTFKGFNESAPIAVAERARLTPAAALAGTAGAA
ncbi:MAG TPA: DUF4386 domain-containing protein [Candidatus Limnocylindrales bacterium]|nr:DUF4386 domain-containing protein [Candidatus Limnocylindrales bacterium]